MHLHSPNAFLIGLSVIVLSAFPLLTNAAAQPAGGLNPTNLTVVSSPSEIQTLETAADQSLQGPLLADACLPLESPKSRTALVANAAKAKRPNPLISEPDQILGESLKPSISLPAKVLEAYDWGDPYAYYGSIRIIKKAPRAISFHLSSSKKITLLEPIVTIPKGKTYANFGFRTQSDGIVTRGYPGRTITATLPNTTISCTGTVNIQEGDYQQITVEMPPEIKEGTSAMGSVTFSRLFSYEAELRIQHNGSDRDLIIPKTVPVPLGKQTVTFPISSPAGDDGLNSDRLLEMNFSINGVSNKSHSIKIIDQTAVGYRVKRLSTTPQSGTVLDVRVQPMSAEDKVVRDNHHDLFVKITQNEETVASGMMIATKDGDWQKGIRLPASLTGRIEIRILRDSRLVAMRKTYVRPSPEIAPQRIQTVPIHVRSMVYDANKGLIYASNEPNNASDSAVGADVVIIDPKSGKQVGTLKIGGAAKEVAISSDGNSLYAIRAKDLNVVRMNLATRSIEQVIDVDGSPTESSMDVWNLCMIPGQNDNFIVARESNYSPNEIVAIHGGAISARLQTILPSETKCIFPSKDPGLFYLYQNRYVTESIRTFRLDDSGMRILPDSVPSESGPYTADGDYLASSSGNVIYGPKMLNLGKAEDSGTPCVDHPSGLVFFMQGVHIHSCDLRSLATIKSINIDFLPSNSSQYGYRNDYQNVDQMIRWGASGLAFSHREGLTLIEDARLIPSAAPADLAVTLETPDTAPKEGQTLIHKVTLTNLGPNKAIHPTLSVTLLGGVNLSAVQSSSGKPYLSKSGIVCLQPGDLEAGTSVTMEIPLKFGSSPISHVNAGAVSESYDPNPENNQARRIHQITFDSKPDSWRTLPVAAYHLIEDSSRSLLWAVMPALPQSVDGDRIASVDPMTGALGEPWSIGGKWNGAAELSENGKYIYVGLEHIAAVVRYDLDSTDRSGVRIVLPSASYPAANIIQTLPGDGTSLFVETNERFLTFDGTTQRSSQQKTEKLAWIEDSGDGETFVGADADGMGFHLKIGPGGVSDFTKADKIQNPSNPYATMEGDLILSATGKIMLAADFSLQHAIGLYGLPCLDADKGLAFILHEGGYINAYSSSTGKLAGSNRVDGRSSLSTRPCFIRWGNDGLATLTKDTILIGRWSMIGSTGSGAEMASTAVPFVSNLMEDDDMDGMVNGMEAMFGTSPSSSNPQPLQLLPTSSTPGTLRLAFKRRSDTPPYQYSFEVSEDLRKWTAASGVTETVLGTSVSEEGSFDHVEALIPTQGAPTSRGFLRMAWHP